MIDPPNYPILMARTTIVVVEGLPGATLGYLPVQEFPPAGLAHSGARSERRRAPGQAEAEPRLRVKPKRLHPSVRPTRAAIPAEDSRNDGRAF